MNPPPNPIATQAAMQVAIQGELGSNSHMAALKALAGSAPSIVSCEVSAEVFEALAAGTVPMAVLPIENSLHGSVFEHYDLLLAAPVRVIGETQLRIHHNVIAAPGVQLSQIRRVLSHPVALSQCRRWLRAHPHIEAAPCYDTAGSVKQLMAQCLTDTAGIAPAFAATQYAAQILIPNIEDHTENYTRFYTLVPDSDKRTVPDANKASLAFSLEHRPGSLIEALAVFREANLNLTRIESRPVHGSPWEYVFFVDLRFNHVSQLDRALAQLRTRCQMLRELGRYTAAQAQPSDPC